MIDRAYFYIDVFFREAYFGNVYHFMPNIYEIFFLDDAKRINRSICHRFYYANLIFQLHATSRMNSLIELSLNFPRINPRTFLGSISSVKSRILVAAKNTRNYPARGKSIRAGSLLASWQRRNGRRR